MCEISKMGCCTDEVGAKISHQRPEKRQSYGMFFMSLGVYCCYCLDYTFRNLLLRSLIILTRSSATTKSTARPSCSFGVLYDISQERIC